MDEDRTCVEIVDRGDDAAPRQLSWKLVLGAERVELPTGGARASFSDLTLGIEADGLDAAVLAGWVSSAYGERDPRASCAGRPAADPAGMFRIVLSVNPLSTPS